MHSDGCTFFPEGDWHSCCEVHDAAYGAGYNRAKADHDLRKCVIRSGHPIQAWIMWVGVRMFGWYRYRKAQQHD